MKVFNILNSYGYKSVFLHKALKSSLPMEILNATQISQKIRRLAIEILERNLRSKEIIIAGINNNGLGFAKLIVKELEKITEIPLKLTTLKLNPANPLKEEITLGIPEKDLKGKAVIIVDDVANSGRTIFYALKPLLNVLPSKVEVAVLVDRTHKSFPIKVDYVGLSLATTLKENIEVDILNTKKPVVNLS